MKSELTKSNHLTTEMMANLVKSKNNNELRHSIVSFNGKVVKNDIVLSKKDLK